MSRYNERVTAIRFEDAANQGFTIDRSSGFTAGAINGYFSPLQPQYNRGSHDGFTQGQDVVQELQLTVEMRNQSLTHATLDRVMDFILGQGKWAVGGIRVPVDSDGWWTWRCIVSYGGGVTQTLYPKCEGDAAVAHDMNHNSFTLSFRNHLAPVNS